MHYEAHVAGRQRQIMIARTGDTFAVTIDGRSYRVDATRIDAQTLSLVVDTLSRQSYEAAVVADPATGQLMVTVAGVPVLVSLNGSRRRGQPYAGGGSTAAPERLAASMPGKIVRVLVKPGDVVHARQPLVVVEAMKMENEMRAGRDGTVTDVHAREGHSVEAGALLLVIQ